MKYLLFLMVLVVFMKTCRIKDNVHDTKLDLLTVERDSLSPIDSGIRVGSLNHLELDSASPFVPVSAFSVCCQCRNFRFLLHQ